MAKYKDLTGQIFGKWTVISYAKKGKNYNTLWDCICDCGGTTSVYGSILTSGKSTKCIKCI